MNYRFTPRADSEAERERDWWRENRLDAPDQFDEEIVNSSPSIRGVRAEALRPMSRHLGRLPPILSATSFRIVEGSLASSRRLTRGSVERAEEESVRLLEVLPASTSRQIEDLECAEKRGVLDLRHALRGLLREARVAT